MKDLINTKFLDEPFWRWVVFIVILSMTLNLIGMVTRSIAAEA